MEEKKGGKKENMCHKMMWKSKFDDTEKKQVTRSSVCKWEKTQELDGEHTHNRFKERLGFLLSVFLRLLNLFNHAELTDLNRNLYL